MKFVKSPEELAEIEKRMLRPRFGPGRRLVVEFRLPDEQFDELLPPGLSRRAESRAVIGIGKWDSNCVGHYDGGSLSLLAEFEGTPGSAGVNMWMNSEAAVLFGRDVLGEPKKLCRSDLVVEGDRAYAWIERGGVRIIEVEADLGPDLGPSSFVRHAYNYRSRQSVDGFHLAGPAVLTRSDFATQVFEHRQGPGRITLRSTVHDPLAEIEVLEVIGADYQVHDILSETFAVAEIPGSDYLPYHWGRLDDPLALDASNIYS